MGDTHANNLNSNNLYPTRAIELDHGIGVGMKGKKGGQRATMQARESIY